MIGLSRTNCDVRDRQFSTDLRQRREDHAVSKTGPSGDVHAGAEHKDLHEKRPAKSRAISRSRGESMSNASSAFITNGRMRSPVIEFLPKMVAGLVTSITQL